MQVNERQAGRKSMLEESRAGEENRVGKESLSRPSARHD